MSRRVKNSPFKGFWMKRSFDWRPYKRTSYWSDRKRKRRSLKRGK